jgi:hypothetical protein
MRITLALAAFKSPLLAPFPCQITRLRAGRQNEIVAYIDQTSFMSQPVLSAWFLYEGIFSIKTKYDVHLRQVKN